MKRIISFTKLRFVMIAFSVIVIAGTMTGTFLTGSFNLGIDFKSGINQRVQIAPVAFKIVYAGEGSVTFNIANDVVRVDVTETETESFTFGLEDYASFGSLIGALSAIPGFTLTDTPPVSTETARIIGLNFPYEMTPGRIYTVNMLPEPGSQGIGIGDVRTALESLGSIQIQAVGRAQNQEFLIRVENTDGSDDVSQLISDRISSLLGSSFGSDRIIVKQTDFVGPRLSQNLAEQTVYLTVFGLGLILIYIWFRFKLSYAVAAIITLLHDVLIMVGFIGITKMEVSTATIAAVFTIIGYSLNDTIVIFDRIRENTGLMRDSDLGTIVDSGISQSLSRTMITSLTTLLAVLALYFFGSGSIKDFALALIVGIVFGTYSSIFIASPIYLGWTQAAIRREKLRDRRRAGVKQVKAVDVTPETVTAEVEKKTVAIPQYERKLKGKRKKRK